MSSSKSTFVCAKRFVSRKGFLLVTQRYTVSREIIGKNRVILRFAIAINRQTEGTNRCGTVGGCFDDNRSSHTDEKEKNFYGGCDHVKYYKMKRIQVLGHYI